MKEVIKCRLCGEEVKNLDNHVKYKHVRAGDIESTEEYYRRFIYSRGYKPYPCLLNCKKGDIREWIQNK